MSYSTIENTRLCASLIKSDTPVIGQPKVAGFSRSQPEPF
jgi:hypothetical protein